MRRGEEESKSHIDLRENHGKDWIEAFEECRDYGRGSADVLGEEKVRIRNSE